MQRLTGVEWKMAQVERLARQVRQATARGDDVTAHALLVRAIVAAGRALVKLEKRQQRAG
jgi:hypothetical protein